MRAIWISWILLLAACDAQQPHFKVYVISEEEVGFQARVEDQFARDAFKPIVLKNLTHFANPANKSKTTRLPREPQQGDQDFDWHFNWYKIDHQPEPPRQVIVDNQFGLQTFNIGQPEFLLVPTKKDNHAQPQGLDHYKAYRITQDANNPRPRVTLADQFGTTPHQVLSAEFFCAPVIKEVIDASGNPRRTPRVDDDKHLVAYIIDNAGQRRALMSDDQFIVPTRLTPRGSTHLLVPTTKESWKKLLDEKNRKDQSKSP